MYSHSDATHWFHLTRQQSLKLLAKWSKLHTSGAGAMHGHSYLLIGVSQKADKNTRLCHRQTFIR